MLKEISQEEWDAHKFRLRSLEKRLEQLSNDIENELEWMGGMGPISEKK